MGAGFPVGGTPQQQFEPILPTSGGGFPLGGTSEQQNAPVGQNIVNSIGVGSENCSNGNASLFGSTALGNIACNLNNPAFWKSVAIGFVGIMLITFGVLLALGATIAGAKNQPIARSS